ncbi:putative ammonium transporter [Nymphon striatum]|nr:putative ammonium transporter [Nymphon striatum]
MKQIEAIIRKSKFDEVKKALHGIEVNFFSYWDVTGVGNEKQGHVYRGISYSTTDIQRRYLSIVVSDEFLEKTVNTILESAYTGNVGDGKIFVSEIKEAYRIRTKESVGLLLYYAWGFNLMYPGFEEGSAGIFQFSMDSFGIGAPENGMTPEYADGGYTWWTDFLFQGMFAATAATIVSGAVAERSRIGKFGEDGKPKAIPGHSIPLATAGVLILWLGWFGFNGGSVLSADPELTSLVLVTTCLSAAAGGVAAMVLSYIMYKNLDLTMFLNGILGGLVGITAGADLMSPNEAILIGLIAGVIIVLGVALVDKLKLDDPVGAVAVHLICGIWGTLAVGIFGSMAGGTQFMTQLYGVLIIGAFCVVTSGIIIGALKATIVGIFAQEEEEASQSALSFSGSVDAYYRTTFGEAGVSTTSNGTSFANQTGFALGTEATFNNDVLNGVINQAYVYWNVSEKTTLTIGRFNTFLGYEVIAPQGNFNYSVSHLFSNGPFSHMGIKADFALSDDISLMLGVMNPWDTNDITGTGEYSFGGQLGFYGQYLNLYYDSGENDGLGFEIDYTGGFDLSDSFFFGINAAYNTNSFTDTGFYGAAIYPQLAASDAFSLGLRGEYFVATAEGFEDAPVTALTLTGSFTKDNLIIKPEIRLDSWGNDNEPIIDNDGNATNSLSSFAIAAIYSF